MMIETALLGLKVLTIWGNLSFRPAKEQPNLFDHEERIGLQVVAKDNRFEIDCWKLWERENGIGYAGHLVSVDAWMVDAEDFVKEERDISTQHLILKYPGKLWGFRLEPGVGYSWKFYDNAVTAEYFKLTFGDWFKAKMLWRGRLKPDNLTGEIGVTIPLGKMFSVRPVGRYYNEWTEAGQKRDWSFRIRLNVDLKIK